MRKRSRKENGNSFDKKLNDNNNKIKDFVIRNTAGNLYWKDRNGNYLGCNENMAKVFKLDDPRNIVGKNDYDFFLDAHHVKKIIENDQLVVNSYPLNNSTY